MSEKSQAPKSLRRNMWPVFAGIIVMLVVMAAINNQLLVAKYKYYFSKPATIALRQPVVAAADGNNTASPNPELGPRLIIPGIGVEAPVIFEQGTAEWQFQVALRSGVVHYVGSAQPGQAGNAVIFGHSSGQSWAPGDYKFIFTQLDKLRSGDLIYVDNGGTRYTYQVQGSKVVTPADVSVLNQGTGHQLTLITCTPVGTSTNRLVITAEQISPAPTSNSTPQAPSQATPSKLPGSAN